MTADPCSRTTSSGPRILNSIATCPPVTIVPEIWPGDVPAGTQEGSPRRRPPLRLGLVEQRADVDDAP